MKININTLTNEIVGPTDETIFHVVYTSGNNLLPQHVSALTGHPQVEHNINYLCDSPEDGPYGPKHVVVKYYNKIKKTFQLR
jgi:hypothetical protein